MLEQTGPRAGWAQSSYNVVCSKREQTAWSVESENRRFIARKDGNPLIDGEVLSEPPRQPKGKGSSRERDHHSTIRDMMVISSHVLSLIPSGKYPMGMY
jgi:hypothetical protein